jgi:hypothetical protein
MYKTDQMLIAEGVAFSSTGTMTVATGDVGAIMFKTPATGYVHFSPPTIRSSAAVTVSLLEKYTETTGDNEADLPARNHNRLSANVAASVIRGGADITADNEEGALTLSTVSIGADLYPAKVAADQKIVLLQDTNYMLAISNASGGNAIVNYSIFWSEEGSI